MPFQRLPVILRSPTLPPARYFPFRFLYTFPLWVAVVDCAAFRISPTHISRTRSIMLRAPKVPAARHHTYRLFLLVNRPKCPKAPPLILVATDITTAQRCLVAFFPVSRLHSLPTAPPIRYYKACVKSGSECKKKKRPLQPSLPPPGSLIVTLPPSILRFPADPNLILLDSVAGAYIFEKPEHPGRSPKFPRSLWISILRRWLSAAHPRPLPALRPPDPLPPHQSKRALATRPLLLLNPVWPHDIHDHLDICVHPEEHRLRADHRGHHPSNPVARLFPSRYTVTLFCFRWTWP